MYYRIYTVGREGRFIGVKECERATDKEAVDYARQVLDGRDVQVYERGRFVEHLAAAYPDISSRAFRSV